MYRMKAGDRLWNGAIATESLARAYSVASIRIEAFERAGMRPPEHLVNGRHKLIATAI